MNQAKERPILFKGEMVRAIREDRKTQTRRILQVPAGWSLETANGDTCRLGKITSPHPKRGRFGAFIRKEIHPGSGKFQHDIIPCPYGAPGDQLWLRETWKPAIAHGCAMDACDCADVWVEFQAGGDGKFCSDCEIDRHNSEWIMPNAALAGNWVPAIHMPRFASRITLEITDVRVERLQDISEEDAKAEGAQFFPDLPGKSRWGQDARWSMESPTSVDQCLGTPWAAFANYFCKLAGNAPKGIHDPRPWDANPWVWVIEFRRIEQEAKAA